MNSQIYIWNGTLRSETPLRIGDENDEIIRDQFERPVIPGTSIAGACRTYLEARYDIEDVQLLFGEKIDPEHETTLIISDCHTVKKHSKEVRLGVQIDSKTKTNAKGALFQRHMLAPGATFSFSITLRTSEERRKIFTEMIENMLHAIDNGTIRIGAFKSTGNGQFSIANCKLTHYDCTNEQDLFAYIDRSKKGRPVTFSERETGDRTIYITIRGKTDTPLLIGGQYPNDSEEPDETYVTNVAGKPIIPGTSLKGVLRHRVRRIANVLNIQDKAKAEARLFGSQDPNDNLGTGNLLLEDIVLQNIRTEVFTRIAIDPFTGGTKDGAMLQEETVSGTFETTLQLKHYNEEMDVPFALLLFALRDLALQKVTVGSRTANGRGFLAIERIDVNMMNRQIALNVARKEIDGDECWLEELQRAIGRAKSINE